MPDISELLAAAARVPTTGPDLVRVERRATALRRRQQVVRGGVALAAALATVFVAQVGLAGPDALEQVPADRPTQNASVQPEPSPEPSAQPSPGVAAPGPPTDAVAAPAAVGPAAEPASPPSAETAPSAAPAPAPEPAAGDGAPTYPAAASCRVDSAGLPPNEERTCRFTATRTGGWRFTVRDGAGYISNTKAFVDVTRNGRTTRYGRDGTGRLSNSPQCGDDVVQPGDLVAVTVGQTDVGYFDIEVAAGAGYGCS